MTTLIGIDIGWSTGRASCGIALSNPELPLPEALARRYGTGEPPIRAARLKLSTLIECLRFWSATRAAQLADAIVVIDGPLGPDTRPEKDRAVDKLCGSGLFRGWSQPTPISHPSSRAFINATYSVLAALGSPQIWTSGDCGKSGMIAVETNPTVALATLMPRIPTEQIVSRKRPLRHNGVSVTAKSDWYWRNGAGHSVGCALAPEPIRGNIAEETDHELCAALMCLALAHQFAGRAADGTTSIALGDHTGIYLLPANMDKSWEPGFPAVWYGQPAFTSHFATRSLTWGKAPKAQAHEESHDDVHLRSVRTEPYPLGEGRYCLGNILALKLSDGGSVWAKHNPWLLGLNSRVRVVADAEPDFQIELTPARTHESSGQWTANPKPATIAARSGWSSQGAHLSLTNFVTINVRAVR